MLKSRAICTKDLLVVMISLIIFNAMVSVIIAVGLFSPAKDE